MGRIVSVNTVRLAQTVSWVKGAVALNASRVMAALDSLARQTVIAEVPGVFMNTVAEAHVVITTALSTLLFGSYLAQYLEHSSSFQ